MNQRNAIRIVHVALGAGLWLLAGGAVAVSITTVRARALKPLDSLRIEFPPGTRLDAGDLVFLQTERGIERIGEVEKVDADTQRALLAIEPAAAEQLNTSTQATCWRTPLSVEDAIDALLPPVIQQKAALRIAAAWERNEDTLARTWGPIAADLITAYLDAIGEDLEAAIRRHEAEVWELTRHHGQSLVREWPAIQERLRPIVQKYLTPVLARQMNDAIAGAPKISIAWHIARGRNAEAFQLMLDFIADYLVEMPDAERDEMREAIRATWDAARADPILNEHFAVLGREILEDEQLRTVLLTIYREAVAENPRTGEFLQERILESEPLRKHLYELIELFAPTAQNVAALCLFDENGATRPEIVHLVRSIALRRRVAWVTLATPEPDAAPLQEGATLAADAGGTNR